MEESDFRQEFIPLFTFQCSIELLFFSEAIKKPRKHYGEFSVGIKRKEATFCVSVLGKADVRRKYYHLSNAIHSVKDTDWQKGRCTVTFSRGPLQHLVVSEVTMLMSLSECANLMKKIVSGLTIQEFLLNNAYCSHIPLEMSQELKSRLKSKSYDNDLDDFDVQTSKFAQRKVLSNSAGSYGSKMLAASREQAKTVAGVKSSSFYDGDSGPSYSFASESPLLKPLPNINKCPPLKRFSPLLGRNQHEPPLKKHRDSAVTYSMMRSLKESNFKKNSSLTAEEQSVELKGFANLGNTCYMNAILQSLLGLDCFANDLLHFKSIKQLPPKCLFLMIYLLLKGKRGNNVYDAQKIMLKNIKRSISATATRFSGYSQHDAHEFLAQCLDQLKEDCASISPEVGSCPVSQNFECAVQHTITCTSCGEDVKKKEMFLSFSVTMPEQQMDAPGDHLALQGLMDNFFSEEEVQYVCDSCQCNTARLSHCFIQLPRVLIIHVKRYRLSHTHLNYYKRSNHVRIPKYLNISLLCADNVIQCPPLAKVIQPNTSTANKMSSPPTPSKPSTPNKLPSPNISSSSPINKLSSTPLSRSFTGNNNVNRPPRGHPLLFNNNTGDKNSSNRAPPRNISLTSSLPSPLHKTTTINKPNTPVVSRNRMEPRNLSNMLAIGETCDLALPSEEEQLKWALSESKALVSNTKEHDDSEDDDPELARVLEESKALFDQSINDRSNHTPSPDTSPSLLGDGADCTGCTSNNNTGDSGYHGSSIDLTLDELQHKEGDMVDKNLLNTTPQRKKYKPPLSLIADHNTKSSTTASTTVASSQVYQLASIVSHIGGSNAGHYISDVYRPGNNLWKSYDDSTITEVCYLYGYQF